MAHPPSVGFLSFPTNPATIATGDVRQIDARLSLLSDASNLINSELLHARS
jgi:hypothetical protein